MTVSIKHNFTLRGGPRNGMEMNGPEMPNGITATHFPCNKTHDEHAEQVSTTDVGEFHQHNYVFGLDHPDDLNYSGTTYRIKNVSNTIEIPAPIAA